ncbi:alpha/beta hydrolase [Demequina sp. NBRC 110051]|uniref:RBBP9/YdeN family alpha/beta hydrolase n=1 Tax=Demequina sp. NBRC 110051 TaxID=1570340 RepID=UPI00190EEAAA|nr:alpha/beta hydrolase [Demequina sp. NBRC 110051]
MTVSWGAISAATPLVIVPGLGDSGAAHWQSLWQSAHPRAVRTAPASWDAPDVDDWISAVDVAATSSVAATGELPLLVAHSLGTYAAAWWLAAHPGRARAALLVAPPDPGRDDAPEAIRGFHREALPRIPVPAVAVASTDDPYGSLGHARWYSEQVGARLEVAGAYGHLNDRSGLGSWESGLALLEELAVSTNA